MFSSLSEGSIGFDQHSAIKALCSQLDLRHTCGVITLLKTGYKQPQTLSSSESSSGVALLQDTPHLAAPPSAHAVSSTDTSSTSSPKNGIKDKESAQMLASELDNLEESIEGNGSKELPTSPDRSKLTLNVGDKQLISNHHPQQTCETMEREWMLLDCCYGIPLFNANVNQQVCERIASQGLCNKDR